MTPWAAKLYRYILLAPAVLPLIYIDGLMYPLLTPKTLALRGCAIIVAALFVYLVSIGTPFFWERLKQWYTWVPGALLVVTYAASWLGFDFYHSFWSTFERGDGLLTFSAGVLYFYLLLISLDEVWVRKLLHLIAWVGAIAGVYVFIQWVAVSLGIDLPFFAQTYGRVGGTMGNAAFLAAYLGMALFVTVWGAQDSLGWKRTLLWWGAGFELLGIFLTATRGTILALILVGLLLLVYEIVRGEGVRRTWALRGGAALALVVVLFVIFRGPLSHAPIEPIKRLASISLSDTTVSSRLFLWGNLLPEAMQHPLLGVGAEQIDTLFNRIYDPTKIVEEWFDRSHNAYLDYLIQFGIIGLLLYMALIASGLFVSFRLARHAPPATGGGLPLEALLFLAFVTYAIQNFFVFDTGVTLWLFFALMAIVFVRSEKSVAYGRTFFNGAEWVGGVAGIALLTLLLPVVVRPLEANRLAFEAYLYHVADVARANQATNEGLALNTYADREFGYNAYFEYTQNIISYAEAGRITNADFVTAYQTIEGVLARNFARYPYDARTGTYLLQVLDHAPPGITVDTIFEGKVIDQVIALSPKRLAPWYVRANIAIGKAKTLPQGAGKSALYRSAIQTLQEYIALVPTLSEPHYVLADLYYALGDKETSTKEAAIGKATYVSNLLTAKRAAAHYETVYDLPSAAFFLQEILNFEPDNEAARADLDMIQSNGKTN